jgi:hypothetical protein
VYIGGYGRAHRCMSVYVSVSVRFPIVDDLGMGAATSSTWGFHDFYETREVQVRG